MKDFIQALNKAIKKEHTKESDRRAQICAGCDLKTKRFYASIVKSKIKDVQGYVCKLCDCPIATKIFAQEKENICFKWD